MYLNQVKQHQEYFGTIYVVRMQYKNVPNITNTPLKEAKLTVEPHLYTISKTGRLVFNGYGGFNGLKRDSIGFMRRDRFNLYTYVYLDDISNAIKLLEKHFNKIHNLVRYKRKPPYLN